MVLFSRQFLYFNFSVFIACINWDNTPKTPGEEAGDLHSFYLIHLLQGDDTLGEGVGIYRDGVVSLFSARVERREREKFRHPRKKSQH